MFNFPVTCFPGRFLFSKDSGLMAVSEIPSIKLDLKLYSVAIFSNLLIYYFNSKTKF